MKEPNTLPDVQLDRDKRGLDLDSVGIRNVAVPLRLQGPDNETHVISANCSVGVGLPKELKGTHMSRFMTLLNEFSRVPLKSFNLQPFLDQVCTTLQSSTANISLDFPFTMTKPAPVSGLEAQMSYQCTLAATLDRTEDGPKQNVFFNIVLPSANLCPCSKAIADYGAHNQRLMIHALISVDPSGEYPSHWLENLIFAAEEAGSCPVYPILKREDEKYVTERQYDNPKFVEDVIRDAALILQEFPGVWGFRITAEAQESIHAHNAWATYTENLPNVSNRFGLDFL